jgi:Flp pilus assembly protein TadB
MERAEAGRPVSIPRAHVARPLLQRTRVRRLLFVLYCVGLIVAVLNLFLAGSQLLGLLSGFVAATSGSVLYYSEEA